MIRYKTQGMLYNLLMKWNPWHGCKKYSEGCLNCYVYRIDARHGKDSSLIIKNKDFNLPLRKNRKGGFKVPPGETLYTCFSSDFFLEEADPWRADAWQIIKYRSDVNFFIITKRILRVRALLPADWGEGYPNVTIACTAENQKRADERLPEYLDLPIKNKIIICEPLLGPINLKGYLSGGISGVIAGGESGEEARTSNYDWFLALRAQCVEAGVPFTFKQTGAHFIKDGKLYNIPRALQHKQAAKAAINTD